MRLLMVVVWGAVAVAACGKADKSNPTPEPSAKPSSDNPAKAPAIEDKAPDPAVASGDNPTEAPSAASGTCAPTIRHVFEVARAGGLKLTDQEREDEIAACEREDWPAALLDCAREAKDVDTLVGTCNKLAFDGEIELKPGRVFDAKADNSAASPAMFELDGDFDVFDSKAGCGMLKKKRYGADAIYVLCKTKVVAGPLTTPAEVKGVMAELNAQHASAHAMMMAIMQNYPSGCSTCRYRVYDANGNYLRDE